MGSKNVIGLEVEESEKWQIFFYQISAVFGRCLPHCWKTLPCLWVRK